MIDMFLIPIIVLVVFWGSLITLVLIIKRIKPKHTTSKHEERFCPNCGRVIPLDARMCPYCSKKFEDY